MAQLKLSVVTPEKTLLECNADSITVPLFDGAKGILVNHAPMIGGLGPGILQVGTAGKSERFFVEGGFVQVDNNVVSVLTNVAMPLSDLNASQLEEKLADLKGQTPETPADKLARERQLTQTRAMLQAARRN